MKNVVNPTPSIAVDSLSKENRRVMRAVYILCLSKRGEIL